MPFEVRMDNVGGFKQLLSARQKKLKDYRIVFIATMKRKMVEIGRFVVAEAKRNAPVDTGTLRSRVDYKVEMWNHLSFGIYEDSTHPPTANISRWTGKVVPANKNYAMAVHETHKTKAHFLTNAINLHAKRRLFMAIAEFHADYFGKV